MKNITLISLILLILAVIGISDAYYLIQVHYQNIIPPCTDHLIFADCGRVLGSSYATIAGVPLSLIGLVHYSILTLLILLSIIFQAKRVRKLVVIQSAIGFVSSLYFVYLQLAVIKAICLYCMVSAFVSVLIFFLAQFEFCRERKQLAISLCGFAYRAFLKRLFFLVDAEKIHKQMTHFGETIGSQTLTRKVTSYCFLFETPKLTQTIAGVPFPHPVGLAAGFDYEARLTQTLASWGFGFQTVGTITNQPYSGNPRPMLGRLPKSFSLMVNKGFKNDGAKAVAQKLAGLRFEIPVGVNIGRTNTRELVTQKQSIADIIAAFTLFEQSKIDHSYYELNISCPNLFGKVSFYPPKNLRELLQEIDKLRIKRPIFVKMPITQSDRETLAIVVVISSHCPKGVIFGNLQKNRQHPALVPEEVARFPAGNFSGKPTFERSNELISLAYTKYRQRFVIIGCGGIMSGRGAYEKICLGASLVQLITGLIFEGPQLVARINFELEELLERDGFGHLSEAVGVRVRS